MTQKISLRILALVHEGFSVREAFDVVLGAGAYEKQLRAGGR